MRVVSLKLNGFRCFDHLELTFAPGLNLLSGGNGSGKTSVVDAIGYALFGASPSRGEDLARVVRDGSLEASIELTFVTGGRNLVVTRSTRAGRGGATESASLSEGTTVLAYTPEAVGSAVSELLNLAEATSSRTLFTSLVGVAQGEIERPYLRPPAEREAYFAPLLNLERYELAGRRIGSVGKIFEQRLAEFEADRARFEGELKGFQSVTTRLEDCREHRQELVAHLKQLDSDSARLGAAVTSYEESRKQFDALRIEQAVAQEGHRSKLADVERTRRTLDEVEAAAATVGKMRVAFDRYEDLDGEIRVMEVQRRELGDIRNEVELLEATLVDGRAEITSERELLETQLEMNQQESEELLASRDVMRGHLDGLRSRARRAEGAQSALEMAISRSERLQKLIVGIESAAGSPSEADEADRREADARRAEEAARAAADDAVAADIAALRARAATLDSARARRSEVIAARSDIEKQEAELRATLIFLQPGHGACPILREPCSNIGGKSLVDRYGALLDAAAARRAGSDEELRVAEARVNEAENARKLAEDREREREKSYRAGKGSSGTVRIRVRNDSGAPGLGPIVDFDEVGHHLSGLSGIISALEPISTAEAQAPIALIGAIAGIGDQTPLPAPPTIALPDQREIEAAQRLVQEGRAAGRAGADEQRQRELSARLAGLLRQIHASIRGALAALKISLATYHADARSGEASLNDSRRNLDELSLARSRLRTAIKQVSSRDLGLLDTEIALSDKRMRLGSFERVEAELGRLREQQEEFRLGYESYRTHALLAQRLDGARAEARNAGVAATAIAARLQSVTEQLSSLFARFDPEAGPRLAAERDEANRRQSEARASERLLEREITLLIERLEEFDEARGQLAELNRRRNEIVGGFEVTKQLGALYRSMATPVSAIVKDTVVAEANRLYQTVSGQTAQLTWDETGALQLHAPSGVRWFAELAHGDQTVAAVAMTLALLRQFPQVGILCLDEPTAHLDAGRRQALAETLSRFRTEASDYIEQIIVISHDDAFAHVANRHLTLQ